VKAAWSGWCATYDPDVSSVWITSVLPAAAVGVCTTTLTLFAARTADRRKFRNDKLLASLEKRRRIYADIMRCVREWEEAESRAMQGRLARAYDSKSTRYSDLEMNDLEAAACNVAIQAHSNISDILDKFVVEMPRGVRRRGRRASHSLLLAGVKERPVVPSGVRAAFELTYVMRARRSIGRLVRTIDRDLGL
jgi:hypothetical protein